MFGHLRRGDYLPTIEQIGHTFKVAPQTVRNALNRLQQDRLISVSPGRHTIVTYGTSLEETLSFTQKYYLARKDDIRAVYCVSGLLLSPVFHEGCQRLTDDGLRQILHICRQKDAGIVSISMFCCKVILNTFHNQLVMTLFLDMVSFFQFPYVTSFDEGSSEEYQHYYRLMVQSCEAFDRGGVFRAFTGLQELTQKTLQNFIDEAAETVAIPEPVSFHWETYRERPQLCNTLAVRIIYGLIKGKYSEGDMLPSYENLALEFSASVNTARRTVGVLRDMGLINSINGVGNQILFTTPKWESLRRPSIRKNIVMAKESAELLLLAAKDVISKKIPELTEDQVRELKRILNEEKHCALETVALVMEYMLVLYPGSSFFEIYGKLLELLLFVYPYLLNRREEEGGSASGANEAMLQALDGKDAGLFSHGFLELFQSVQLQIGQIECTYILVNSDNK